MVRVCLNRTLNDLSLTSNILRGFPYVRRRSASVALVVECLWLFCALVQRLEGILWLIHNSLLVFLNINPCCTHASEQGVIIYDNTRGDIVSLLVTPVLSYSFSCSRIVLCAQCWLVVWWGPILINILRSTVLKYDWTNILQCSGFRRYRVFLWHDISQLTASSLTMTSVQSDLQLLWLYTAWKWIDSLTRLHSVSPRR